MKSRKMLSDPALAQTIAQNLRQNQQKYSASLGSPQAYTLLMRKVDRIVPRNDAAARRSRVAAQDKEMMGGQTKPIGRVSVK